MLGNAQVAGLFPVVYCSDGFCDLTGFSRAEVMQRGCACSFLYGPDTSELVRQQIRKALDEHKEFKAELILYRKSGEGPPGQPSSHPIHSLSFPILSSPSPHLIPPSHIPLSSSSPPCVPGLSFLLPSPQSQLTLNFPSWVSHHSRKMSLSYLAGQSYEHACLNVISALPCLPPPCLMEPKCSRWS